MKKTVKIAGMSCMHCKMRVEKALKSIDGINDVSVDLINGSATMEVESTVDDLIIKNAIKEAGYKPGKIEG